MAENTPAQAGAERRKVLDESQVSAEVFDEGLITDIEARLATTPKAAAKPAGGEKVELDKADLPMLDGLIPPPEEEPGPVEVDLAGDIPLEPPEPEAEPHPDRKKLYIIAAAAGLTLGLAGGIWWWLSTPKAPAPVIAATGVFSDRIPDPRLMLRLDMEPFLIPLVKEEKAHLLKLAISVEVGDPVDREALAFHKLKVRDAIYRLMRDRPAEELDSARGRSLLQTQIKTEINHLLGQNLVYQVYFTDFVITGRGPAWTRLA